MDRTDLLLLVDHLHALGPHYELVTDNDNEVGYVCNESDDRDEEDELERYAHLVNRIEHFVVGEHLHAY